MSPRALLLALLVVATTTQARGRPGPECVAGSFAAEGALGAGRTPVSARVRLADGQISITPVCPSPVAARVTARGGATVVSAAWRSCPGMPGKIRLKAKIAAQCATLSGVLTSRKARPRRRTFTATRLAAPTELLATLDGADLQARMSRESLPWTIRAGAEALNPEVGDLIAYGADAVGPVLAEFQRETGLADDLRLSLLAYVLERIGDPRAVPVLADWLEAHLFATGLWADEFATHAIKVLAGQPDLNTDSYAYGIDAKLDTIAQVRGGAAAGPRTAGLHPAATVTAEDRNRCPLTVVVTGINEAGQQETVPISYKSLFLDIQEQIAVETDDAKRAALQRQLTGFRDADERSYGGTEYTPIPGFDVGVKSNCGGSVTERLLNAVAERNGLPLRLGDGNTTAKEIRDLAQKFGREVGVTELDPFTVIAHEGDDGGPVHVEIPMSTTGGSAVVFSKDNQGIPRLHTVSTASLNPFGLVQRLFNFRPFSRDGITTRFYRLDPSRIVGISVDSSACPCEFAAGGSIPVAITEPVDPTTSERVVRVAGTVGSAEATGGNLRVNGSLQGLTLDPGGFSAQVVLGSGDNTVRVAVDGLYGRRGCAERTIRSTTPRTTISATLTWNLAGADVDLYVTQPDTETSWYSSKTTTIGGRLDVDNTSGFGPENYFLSSEEGDTILAGHYAVRVHYFSDHQRSADTPTRVVTWRLVVIVNEGAPQERREFHTGTLSADNPGNDGPGGSGPDWATAADVTL